MVRAQQQPRSWGAVVVVMVCLLNIGGCGSDATPPAPPTRDNITTTLLHQLDLCEEACENNTIGQKREYLSALNMSLVFLRGRLGTDNAATEAQLAELDGLHARLTHLLRDGIGPVPPIQALLAEIRQAVEGIESSGPSAPNAT